MQLPEYKEYCNTDFFNYFPATGECVCCTQGFESEADASGGVLYKLNKLK